MRADGQEPDTRPTVADERAIDREVHIHQVPLVVNPAVVRGRRSNLPREVCDVSWIHD